eukprot:4338839-Alexandrium_andersonii.AAC.1
MSVLNSAPPCLWPPRWPPDLPTWGSGPHGWPVLWGGRWRHPHVDWSRRGGGAQSPCAVACLSSAQARGEFGVGLADDAQRLKTGSVPLRPKR